MPCVSMTASQSAEVHTHPARGAGHGRARSRTSHGSLADSRSETDAIFGGSLDDSSNDESATACCPSVGPSVRIAVRLTPQSSVGGDSHNTQHLKRTRIVELST